MNLHSKSRARWLWLGLLALLFHVPAIAAVSWLSEAAPPVVVLSMTPNPNGKVRTGDAPLEIELQLSAIDEEISLNPLGARLYWTPEGGEESLVAVASSPSPGALRFRATRAPGLYKVVLDSGGPTPLLPSPYFLDGELLEVGLPSGDGKPGGDFVATFEVVDPPPLREPMIAHLVTESPAPPTPTSPPPSSAVIVAPSQKAAPRPRAKTKSISPATTKSTPVRKVVEELPMRAPSKEATVEDLLTLDPGDFEALFGEEADLMAERLQEERDREGLLGGWEEDIARTAHAFNGDGPKVQPGNQKAVQTHRPEVFTYIAQMHKEIHPLWAGDYLLNLDLHHRSPSSPLNNPDLKTVLEIVVGGDGKIDDVQVVESSGLYEYDGQAIYVAWRSSPGLSLPKAMVSEDGKAYLHWSFWRNQRQCGTFGVEVYVLGEDGDKESLGFDLKKVEAEEDRIGVRDADHDHSHHDHDGHGLAPAPLEEEPKPAPEEIPEATPPADAPAKEQKRKRRRR